MPLKDSIPPHTAAENARKRLKLREQFKRGCTHIGVVHAHQLSSGNPVESEIIKRMVSCFARHAVDEGAKNFSDEDTPSAGYIAWLLWGDDEGRAWAEHLKKRFPAGKVKTASWK